MTVGSQHEPRCDQCRCDFPDPPRPQAADALEFVVFPQPQHLAHRRPAPQMEPQRIGRMPG